MITLTLFFGLIASYYGAYKLGEHSVLKHMPERELKPLERPSEAKK